MTEDRKKAARGRLKRVVAATAPELARALGGPLAGAAVEKLSRVVFGDATASEDALEEALKNASPDQLVALARADFEFRIALRQAAVEEGRIDAGDRASARARQQAMDDATPAALGALIVLGFFVTLAAMVLKRLPPGTETEFSIMLGALATMTAAVVNYFFGSSQGSREKTRLLAGPKEESDAA